MKKPSDYCKMENTGYLGHFYQDQHLDRGHNDCEPGNEEYCKQIRQEVEGKEKANRDYADKRKSDLGFGIGEALKKRMSR